MKLEAQDVIALEGGRQYAAYTPPPAIAMEVVHEDPAERQRILADCINHYQPQPHPSK